MLTELFDSLSHAPFMAHSIDKDGIICNVSQGWLDALGYQRGEVLGRKSTDFLTPDSRAYAETVILPDFWKTGTCKNIHYKMIKKNGEIMDVLLHGTADKDENGEYYRSVAFLVDITDRIVVENELRQYKDDLELLILERTEELEETKEMYRTLSKASPVGIFRIDRHGQCVYTNEQWREFAGMTKDDTIGDGWIDAIYPDDRDQVLQNWQNAFTNKREFRMEFRLKDDIGNITWVLGQAKPVYGGENGYVGTITDITTRKEVLPKLIEIKQQTKCRSYN